MLNQVTAISIIYNHGLVISKIKFAVKNLQPGAATLRLNSSNISLDVTNARSRKSFSTIIYIR